MSDASIAPAACQASTFCCSPPGRRRSWQPSRATMPIPSSAACSLRLECVDEPGPRTRRRRDDHDRRLGGLRRPSTAARVDRLGAIRGSSRARQWHEGGEHDRDGEPLGKSGSAGWIDYRLPDGVACRDWTELAPRGDVHPGEPLTVAVGGTCGHAVSTKKTAVALGLPARVARLRPPPLFRLWRSHRRTMPSSTVT